MPKLDQKTTKYTTCTDNVQQSEFFCVLIFHFGRSRSFANSADFIVWKGGKLNGQLEHALLMSKNVWRDFPWILFCSTEKTSIDFLKFVTPKAANLNEWMNQLSLAPLSMILHWLLMLHQINMVSTSRSATLLNNNSSSFSPWWYLFRHWNIAQLIPKFEMNKFNQEKNSMWKIKNNHFFLQYFNFVFNLNTQDWDCWFFRLASAAAVHSSHCGFPFSCYSNQKISKLFKLCNLFTYHLLYSTKTHTHTYIYIYICIYIQLHTYSYVHRMSAKLVGWVREREGR